MLAKIIQKIINWHVNTQEKSKDTLKIVLLLTRPVNNFCYIVLRYLILDWRNRQKNKINENMLYNFRKYYTAGCSFDYTFNIKQFSPSFNSPYLQKTLIQKQARRTTLLKSPDQMLEWNEGLPRQQQSRRTPFAGVCHFPKRTSLNWLRS